MAPEERRGERAPPAVAEGMRREGAPAPAPPVLSGAAPTTSGQADGVPEEAMVDMVREGENSETIRDPAKPSAPPGAAVNTVGPAVAACCERAGDALGGAVAGGFARAGRLVASRPWWAIAAALAVAAAMLGGLAFFEQESRQSKLWVPSGTEAQRDKASVERAGFPRPPRVELIIFEQVEDAGDGGPGALRPEVLSALEAFRAELDEISVDVGDGWDGGPFALDDLCVPASTEGGTGCLTPSILDAFPDGPSGWATQADVLAAVNGPFLRSRGFGDALGGVVRDGDGRVVGATALAMQVLLVDDAILLPDNSWSNPPAEAWEARMLETAARADTALAPDGVRVRRFAERTFDDEFGGAVTSDVQLLQIAIVLILAYTGWATTRWSPPCGVGLRFTVVAVGIVVIGLSFGMAIGVCSYAGLFYSPLMSIAPFLLLGLGVDGLFLLLAELDVSDPAKPVPERVADALGNAGPSLLMTSLTNFAVFLIGSTTSLPALRYFCIYLAASLAFLLLLQSTILVASLALDLRRSQASRVDVVCCVRSPPYLEELPDPEQPNGCDPCGRGCCGVRCETVFSNRLFAALGRALVSRPGKAVVLAAFAALLGGGIAGLTQLKVESSILNYIASGSYARDFFDTSLALFRTSGDPTAVYFEDLDLASDAAAWGALDAACEAARASKTTVANTVICWSENLQAEYPDLRGDLAVAPAPEEARDAFAETLRTFLASGEGAEFADDLVFSEDGASLAMARFTARHIIANSSNEEVELMDGLRADVRGAVAEVSEALAPQVRIYGGRYLQAEQYKAIANEAIRNIGFSMLMIAVVVVVMMPRLTATVVTVTSILMVFVNVLGYSAWWGVKIDSISVIILTIAAGLSVDYVVHPSHAFIIRPGTPAHRTEMALKEIGTAVFNGGFSTWLAVVVMAASQTYVFQVFFKILFLVTTLGLAHALLFLPVALCLVAPKPLGHAKHAPALSFAKE